MGKKKATFGDEIRALVKACPMGHNALARAAGIDRGALSRFANGKRGMSIESLDKLAAALGLRIVQDKPIRGEKRV